MASEGAAGRSSVLCATRTATVTKRAAKVRKVANRQDRSIDVIIASQGEIVNRVSAEIPRDLSLPPGRRQVADRFGGERTVIRSNAGSYGSETKGEKMWRESGWERRTAYPQRWDGQWRRDEP